MADEMDESLDDRIQRMVRRAENFRELLKDGEEVTIAFQDGDLLVEESYRSKFERKHPKLYGRMLSIEEQVKAGSLPFFLALVAFGVFAMGLQLGWWVGVLGEAMCVLLNNWWFYGVAPPALLYLAHLLCRIWGKQVYRRHRKDLLELVAAAGLDRDLLLVMLRDEDDLDQVVYFLKMDHAPTI